MTENEGWLCTVHRNKNSSFQQVAGRRSVGNSWQKMAAWIQNFITLSYLLGITWLIGFTVKFDIVMEYIFVFLNASIGVMVLLYKVVFNRKIREASQRAISRQTITSKFSMWKTESSSGYSSGNGSSLGDTSNHLNYNRSTNYYKT